MGKIYNQVLSNISTALASTMITVIRRELPTSLLPVADLSQQMRKQYLSLCFGTSFSTIFCNIMLT